jgi:hypothetical protein
MPRVWFNDRLELLVAQTFFSLMVFCQVKFLGGGAGGKAVNHHNPLAAKIAAIALRARRNKEHLPYNFIHPNTPDAAHLVLAPIIAN